MEAVFLKVVELSLTASWLILLIAALRLVLKRAPKWVNCLLWALAALRLVCPFSIESAMSLMPKEKLVDTGKLQYELQQVDAVFTPAAAPAAVPVSEAGSAWSWVTVAGIIWLLGIAALLICATLSYLRLKKSVRVSLPMKGNVRLCDHIRSPFILGIFRPIICIPSELSEADLAPVLAHERAHIARGDNLWKPLGYGILMLHWFNPLCWLAYFLLCRDIEMACDEKVIRNLDLKEKKTYSRVLLEYSVRSRRISACPLAFGEVGVKQRVSSVLRYRKPAAWVTAISMILCAVLACCFLTSPIEAEGDHTLKLQTVTVNANLRSSPSASSKCVATLWEGSTVSVIRMEEVGGREWCYVIYGSQGTTGWVLGQLLSDVEYEATVAPPEEPEEIAVGMILTAGKEAEIRSAPTTMAQLISTVKPGTELTILRMENIAGEVWYYGQYAEESASGEAMTTMGWIIAKQVSGEQTPNIAVPEELPEEEPVEAVRTAIVNVNLRKLPSVSSECIDTLWAGTTVSVLQTVTADGHEWSYVTYGTKDGWVISEALGDMAEVEAPESVSAQPTTAEVGAVLTMEHPTEVWSSPSNQSRLIGKMEPGTELTILRVENIGGTYWYYGEYIEQTVSAMGWVRSDLPEGEEELPNAAGLLSQPETPATIAPLYIQSEMEVRSAPSKDARVIGVIAAGTQMNVLSMENVGGLLWYYGQYVEKTESGEEQAILGWVSFDQLTDDAPPAPEARMYGMSVSLGETTELWSSPSKEARCITTVQPGTIVTIERSVPLADKIWYYVSSENAAGWVTDVTDIDAKLVFCDYAFALWEQTPDTAEQYMDFASEAARQAFRDGYAPRTSTLRMSDFVRVKENLWVVGVEEETGAVGYQFVGRTGDQFWVYPTAEQLPDALAEGLDMTQFTAPED